MSNAVLVVDGDAATLGALTHAGRTRGLEMVGVRTPLEAADALSQGTFAVAIVDLGVGDGGGLDVVRQVRSHDPAIQSIVMSADGRLSRVLETYEHDVVAFILKPVDAPRLFAAVELAFERRRDVLERQRLTWELRLVNEVANIVSSSFELDEALQRALERVSEAFDTKWALVRLVPADDGPAEVRAIVGATMDEARSAYARRQRPWPTDRVLEHGVSVRIDDALNDPTAEFLDSREWRSTIAVPVIAGDLRLGAVSLTSDRPHRFSTKDEQLLLTIGRQFGVAAANSRLYERVHRAKVEWERTFDAISDPIVLFDSQGRAVRSNAALAGLRGWKVTAIPGRTCAEVGFCGGNCPDCAVHVAARDNRRIDREVTTSDGRIFAVTTLPVTGEAGAVVQFAKEVTEERERARRLAELSQELTSTNVELVSTLERLRSTQVQLVQSEKLSAIGQLVAGVAHELNNPLTSIIGYAQLVHEELASRPELAARVDGLSDDVSRILSESERAAGIVRNLLTFARRQGADRTRQLVPELCARVAHMRAYDLRVQGVDLVTDVRPDLPPVYVDNSQIQQALLNLFLNAEQAMKDSPTRRLEIRASSEPECGSVLIAIADTGHGIEPSNLRRVFDPFFTTRGVGEGTGLGLSIVYGIVRDHGGQVWVESEPGKGSTFFMRLPARSLGEPVGLGVVLVAHSDAVFRDFLGAAFAGWGFAVRTAANSREALESLDEDDIGLVVLDGEIVGPDPARWRAAWAPLRARAVMIAMSSASGDEDTVQFLRDEARVVLAAPHDLCQIRRALVAATGVQP